MFDALPYLLKKSFKQYGNNMALCSATGRALTYNDISERISGTMTFLKESGIQKGDRVAILSHNMPNWGIVYLSVVSCGAIAVPLLPDFSAGEIDKILNHAEPKMLFVGNRQKHKTEELNQAIPIYTLNDLDDIVLKYTNDSNAPFYENSSVVEDDTAVIIYTSGTTGNPKGVMLSHKNLATNVSAAGRVQEVTTQDVFLSILPLAHTYENSLSFLLPLANGAQVHYLDGPPTPAALNVALKKVKPTIINSVPMIIEKVYRKKIEPALNDSFLKKSLIKIPFIRKAMHKVAGKKLMEAFGGRVKFFGIGGAKLNAKVEAFLKEAKFPYAIGYGLTETAPLLAGTGPALTKKRAIGPAIDIVEMELRNKNKRGCGEVWVKGPNIMQGYYKMEEETQAVLKDGWFNTGDLGFMDKDGYLYHRGRKKNIIVGSNGENIYPEDIESLINNFKHVVESLVVEKKGKLVALVHFNKEELEKHYANIQDEVSQYVEKKIDELREELLNYVNTQVNKMNRLQLVYVQENPFVKTPTQKIKRYLYN